MMKEEKLFVPDRGNGRYINPVIFADYSDPDVIRYGETYYMTASSFNYTPGLPILKSYDLINWELVNYALKNVQYDNYSYPQHSKGVWAPSIRFHEGYFYIYYGMPDEGIFMVKAKDPEGEWDDPVCVLEGKGLIDSCPFWDDDGRAYIIHGYAKSRIGFKSILGIFEMNPEGTKAISEDHFIFDGQKTQQTIEGPKVHKENGYYYIFAPAGGVRLGHQTVLRSKDIHGPYEEKIVMKQGSAITNGPHQGAWVRTPEGADYFIHFQDKGLYGRIIHLQPMCWENDWPIIGKKVEGEDYGEPVTEGEVNITQSAAVGNKTGLSLQASDDFASEKLSLIWQFMGNHRDDFYSLTENKGAMTLPSINPNNDTSVIIYERPNVLTQKIVTPFFDALVELDFDGLHNNEQAGLLIVGGNYASIVAKKDENGKASLDLILGESENGRMEEVVTELLNVSDKKKIYLTIGLHKSSSNPEAKTINPIAITPEHLEFVIGYSFDDEEYKYTDTDFFPKDQTWVGSKLGIFSMALDTKDHDGRAIFRDFKVRVND